MAPYYWVEMTLEVPAGSCVDKRVGFLDTRHDGQITYTFTETTRLLALAMTVCSDEQIEMIPPKVVGLVRSALHELGFSTPGWPEPVSIDDVRIKLLTPTTAACS